MKLFLKIVMTTLLTSNLYAARPLFLIDWEGEQGLELKAKAIEVLHRDFKIPRNFIQSREVTSCKHRPRRESLLHLCLNQLGEYTILWANHEVLKNSFASANKKRAQ